MAETDNASLATTDLHWPINGIRFQLIRRFPREDAGSECWSDKYQEDCKYGSRRPHNLPAWKQDADFYGLAASLGFLLLSHHRPRSSSASRRTAAAGFLNLSRSRSSIRARWEAPP